MAEAPAAAPRAPRSGAAAAPPGAAAPSAPVPEKVAKAATEYVILRRVEDGWVPESKTVNATSREAALKSFTKPLEEGGQFKAVARSAWTGGLTVEKKETVETVYTELKD